MGCSTLRPWPLHVQGRSLRAAVFLTAPVLSLIVPQLSELFFKPLQTFIQDTLLDWMEGGNAPPAKMILCVLVLEKFLVFYSHTVQIYFTGFDLVSVFCLFFDLTSFWTSS